MRTPRALGCVPSATLAYDASRTARSGREHEISPEEGEEEQEREEFKKDKSEGEICKVRESDVAKEGPELLTEVEKRKEEPATTKVGAWRIVSSVATPVGWKVICTSLFAKFGSYKKDKNE